MTSHLCLVFAITSALQQPSTEFGRLAWRNQEGFTAIGGVRELSDGRVIISEFYPAPTLSVPVEHFHVHFYAADTDALRAWYVKHFGAAMPTARNANAAGVPGISASK